MAKEGILGDTTSGWIVNTVKGQGVGSPGAVGSRHLEEQSQRCWEASVAANDANNIGREASHHAQGQRCLAR